MIRSGKPDFDPSGLYPTRAAFFSSSPNRGPALPRTIDDDEPATFRGMACAYLPRVSAFHDGELTGEDGRRVCAHIQKCHACRKMLVFLERISTTFSAANDSGLLHPAPHHPLQHRIPQRSFRPPADVRWARRLTSVAAALFLAAVGRAVYLQVNSAARPSSSTDRLRHPVNQITPDQYQSSPAKSPTQPARMLEQQAGRGL